MKLGRDIIFLTGFSGTGKSHVGRLVAKSLEWELVDIDEMVARCAGAPIVQIFEQGEEHFRALERDALCKAARGHRRVVSTGGGVPVSEENRRLMKAAGVTVRLQAAPETIYARLKRTRRANDEEDGRSVVRPLLRNDGEEAPLGRIRELLASREDAYATADVTINTDGTPPLEVARLVVEAWASFGGDAGESSAG